jgi:hypothetical protein
MGKTKKSSQTSRATRGPEQEMPSDRNSPAGKAAEKQPANRDHQREQVSPAVGRAVERSDVDPPDDQTHASRREAVATPNHPGEDPRRDRTVAESGAGSENEPHGDATDMPRRGNTYRCEQCGMELQVTTDCACSDPEMVRLECCGQDLTKELA